MELNERGELALGLLIHREPRLGRPLDRRQVSRATLPNGANLPPRPNPPGLLEINQDGDCYTASIGPTFGDQEDRSLVNQVRLLWGLGTAFSYDDEISSVLKRFTYDPSALQVGDRIELPDLKLAPGISVNFVAQYINAAGRPAIQTFENVRVSSPAIPAGESPAGADVWVANVDGALENLAYDATDDWVRAIDPSAQGVWTGPVTALPAEQVHRFRFLAIGGTTYERDAPGGATLAQTIIRVPAPESDVWFPKGVAGDLHIRFGPIPDDAVRRIYEIRTTPAGELIGQGNLGPWVEVPAFGEHIADTREYQWRVRMTRARFPYLASLRNFTSVVTG